MSFENATRYRRKSETVRAVRVPPTGDLDRGKFFFDPGNKVTPISTGYQEFAVAISDSYAAAAVAYDGDWIVQWPDGTLAVLKDDLFRARYEATDEEAK